MYCHFCDRKVFPVQETFQKECGMWFQCQLCKSATCLECHFIIMKYTPETILTLIQNCDRGMQYLCLCCRRICPCVSDIHWSPTLCRFKRLRIQNNQHSVGTCVNHHPALLNKTNLNEVPGVSWDKISNYVPCVSTELLYSCINRTIECRITVVSPESHWFSDINSRTVVAGSLLNTACMVRIQDVIPTGFYKNNLTQTLMLSINDSTMDENWFSSEIMSTDRLKKMTFEFVQRAYSEDPGVLHTHMPEKEWIRRLRLWATENSSSSVASYTHNIEVMGVRCTEEGVQYCVKNTLTDDSEWVSYDCLGKKNSIYIANFLFQTLPGVVHCALGPNILCSLTKPSNRQKIENLWAFGIVDEFERREMVEKLELIKKYKWSKRTQVDAYLDVKIPQLRK